MVGVDVGVMVGVANSIPGGVYITAGVEVTPGVEVGVAVFETEPGVYVSVGVDILPGLLVGVGVIDIKLLLLPQEIINDKTRSKETK